MQAQIRKKNFKTISLEGLFVYIGSLKLDLVLHARLTRALPVLRGKELVGIISENDLFQIMLEMLGARRAGVRLSVLMENRPGEIAKLSQAIYKNGGDITALSTFEGDTAANFLITMKVDGIEQSKIKEIVEPLVLKLLNIGTS